MTDVATAASEPKPHSMWRRVLAPVVGLAGLYVFMFGVPGVGKPTCHSSISSVISASKENGSPLLPKIIDVVDEQTVSDGDDGLRCTGTAVLSNAMKQPITFGNYKVSEKWFVKIEPAGDPTS